MRENIIVRQINKIYWFKYFNQLSLKNKIIGIVLIIYQIIGIFIFLTFLSTIIKNNELYYTYLINFFIIPLLLYLNLNILYINMSIKNILKIILINISISRFIPYAITILLFLINCNLNHILYYAITLFIQWGEFLLSISLFQILLIIIFKRKFLITITIIFLLFINTIINNKSNIIFDYIYSVPFSLQDFITISLINIILILIVCFFK